MEYPLWTASIAVESHLGHLGTLGLWGICLVSMIFSWEGSYGTMSTLAPSFYHKILIWFASSTEQFVFT